MRSILPALILWAATAMAQTPAPNHGFLNVAGLAAVQAVGVDDEGAGGSVALNG